MSKNNRELPETLTDSLDCDQGAVRAVRFNVDGNYCLTCGSDKSLKLWNPKRKLVLKTYTGHGYEVLDARGTLTLMVILTLSQIYTIFPRFM